MSWVSPTGYVDYSDKWIDEPNTYDGDVSTYAWAQITTAPDSGVLDLTISAITCSKIRLYNIYGIAWDTVKVWVRKDGSWILLYDGPTWMDGWKEFSFTEGSVDAMRISPHAYDAFNFGYCFEAAFWQTGPPPAVGVHFGDGLVTIQT